MSSPGTRSVSHGTAATPLRQSRVGRVTWWVRGTVPAEELEPILRDPERVIAESPKLIKNSRVVTLARVSPQLSKGARWLLRRLNYGKRLHQLRDLCRPSRTRRAYQMGLALETLGLPTPRVLAAGEERRFRWPVRAYLVMEEIEGARNLNQYFRDANFLPRPAIEQLAEVLARLHEHGFSHRDLKPSNILLGPDLKPWLIDLDGVREHRQIDRIRAVKDLLPLARGFARLPFTLKWRGARLLRHYCQQRRWEGEFRALFLELANQLRRKANP